MQLVLLAANSAIVCHAGMSMVALRLASMVRRQAATSNQMKMRIKTLGSFEQLLVPEQFCSVSSLQQGHCLSVMALQCHGLSTTCYRNCNMNGKLRSSLARPSCQNSKLTLIDRSRG
jgi:hypothetical protein